MQRTVATHHNNMAIALLHGRHGQLHGVELMLRKDRFGMHTRFAQQA